MSAGLTAGLVLALAASVALNTGYLLQHTGAAEAPAITPRRPVATFRSLLASRAWVLGLVFGTVGWAMHVGALSKAPISLVEAFVAGGLALALPLARRLVRQRLTLAELWGVCLIAAALAGLAVGLHDPGTHGRFDTPRLAGYLGASLVLAALLVIVPSRSRRAQALALSGGALYGAGDVATKALTGIAERQGLVHALLTPWLALVAFVTVAAFFCFQRGLQMGRALPVIALMTAATNAVSIAGGFAVFGDPIGHTPALVALHAGALALVVVAASLLAPAQAAVSEGLSTPS